MDNYHGLPEHKNIRREGENIDNTFAILSKIISGINPIN